MDDASAVQHNPANLVDLPGTEFQFAPSLIYMHVDYAGPAKQNAETADPWKLLPNLFVGVPFKDGKYALGLGVTVPYGLANKWDEDSAGFRPGGVLRYQAPHFTELLTINANPSFAAKLTDYLQVGLGLDVTYSRVTMKQYYPWAVFPGSIGTEPDGDFQAKGSGFAAGGNIGLTWLITRNQRLALTYRSPMDVHYRGEFTLNNVTPTAEAAGATRVSDFGSKISFPTIVSIGYGIQLSERVRLEADAEWLQFSRFSSLELGVGNNSFLFPSTKLPQHWRDTFTAGIAADWRFARNWILRGGFQHYQTPVPDSTFSPSIPDSDQNVLTAGLAYRRNHHSFEIAYGLDFYDDRHIRTDQNPAFNGDYGFTVHLFSLAYRRTF